MSKPTLYFYDLETSGINPSEARIMQFAGQRTDLDLKPIGKPDNILIKLTNDVLPDPYAILLTGITPQQTIQDGVTEAEFLDYFHSEVVNPATIFVGFNSVRFDDEFMRYLHYRNFYDPYEWQWKDGRAKWDLLDVVRMMRALRPSDINWPEANGKPTNRLELLTKANNISHEGAHDAKSDVMALVDLARLIKSRQPKLFNYLLEVMTSKEKIGDLISQDNPFVYTSGKYSDDFLKTTAVAKLVGHPKRQGIIVFDLRHNPDDYANLSVEELASSWYPKDKDQPRLPLKTLQFNRCPAIAPLSVLDGDSQKRIKLTLEEIDINYTKLQKIKKDFAQKALKSIEVLDKEQEKKYKGKNKLVDSQLYDGFFSNKDKSVLGKVRSSKPDQLNVSEFDFSDSRLTKLLPLYKARNFSKALSNDEIESWEKYRSGIFFDGGDSGRANTFFSKLSDLNSQPKTSKNDKYLLEELKLYGESILPYTD